MRHATLTLILLFAAGSAAQADYPSGSISSAPHGSRGFYGTDFGNRYRYFGLGYGYGIPSSGMGGWSGFNSRRGYGGSGYGAYGGSGYGGYGGYGRYGNYQLQQQMLHQEQMKWTMEFAPIPDSPPNVSVNPLWNPYQSRLKDDFYQRQEPTPEPQSIENPFARHSEK